MLSDNASLNDAHVTEDLQNHLFENNNVVGMETHRFSLSTINIIRGRDHGVPPYNQLRKFAGLSLATTFEELATEIGQENLSNLKQVYTNVDDIDLFTGGLTENSLKDAILGPTFARIFFKTAF